MHLVVAPGGLATDTPEGVAASMMVLVSARMALVGGPVEELHWRGMFPDAVSRTSLVWGVLFPPVEFVFWHFVPQSLYLTMAGVG